ncbi:ester cyclase [Deinococcus sp. Arct2-2]|uniref:ester cyclase n=1 Tax=Deinococcus sp. Arct2-2 TaxID=2568653 RepID=UPI0010A2D3CA|nr:ester cyclase [Deinococcus sp. Arct2-2]THF67717.1 ester cyclase [Deinococcus sp. Arct2-2]
MSTEEHKAVVRRFYEEAFNQGQVAVLDDLLAPEYRDFGATPAREGIEAAKANLLGLQAGFDQIRFDIKDLLAEGDRVAVRWTGRMLHAREFFGFPATQQTVTFSGISIYVLQAGRLLETYPAQDLHGLLQQLGGHRS